MNLPNKLTMLRILLVPVFIVLFLWGHDVWAAVVFIAASLTDMLDGKIARKYNLISNFGKIMDPLADKILVVSALVCMVELDWIPGWMLIVILAREFMVMGMRTVAAGAGIIIAAGMSGKIKTVLQMLAVIFLLLHDWPISLFCGLPLGMILLWAAVVMTVYSGCEYIWQNRAVFKG